MWPGLISIDQEKAFDWVDHGYIFKVLNVFGFGDCFISWVKFLYSQVSCLVKVDGGLSRPVAVRRVIRQGCPLSGQLYSLAIEPLLHLHKSEGGEGSRGLIKFGPGYSYSQSWTCCQAKWRSG